MLRVRILSVAALGLCVAGSALVAQEATAKKDRGPLPANFGKLALSEEQKAKAYPIHEEYQKQIDDLSAQIKKLQSERSAKLRELLTPGQKERLKELQAEENAKRTAETAKRDAAEAAKKAGEAAKEAGDAAKKAAEKAGEDAKKAADAVKSSK